MKNLAGAPEDEVLTQVKSELSVARIEAVADTWVDGERGEVNTTMGGRIVVDPYNPDMTITLKRAWRYWIAKGPVALDIAKELYQDPAGRRDIRVAGHCGCPPPEQWAEHFSKKGRRLLPLTEKARVNQLVKETPEGTETFITAAIKQLLNESDFVENPAEEAAWSYVDCYHIDSEVGLRVFRDTLMRAYR